MLGDELSKFIWEKRILYSVTGDKTHIYNIVTQANGNSLHESMSKKYIKKAFDWYKTSLKEIQELKGKAKEDNKIIIICGAGGGDGLKLAEFFRDFPNCICCDKYADGKKIVSTNEAVKLYPNGLYIIASPTFYPEISKELQDLGIARWNIAYIDCRNPHELLIAWGYDYWKRDIELCEEESYFDEKFLYHDEKEVFVDCGFFDGASSRTFQKWSNKKYEKIIAFEPNEKLYQSYMRNQDIERLKLYNAGCWNESGNLYFKEEAGGSSFIDIEGSSKISVLSLDDVLDGERVTFLKMDIEGSELKALEGAKETIQKFHPKLAICVYHKPEDIMDIPRYLMSLYDGYKFYLRHYNYNECGTVLYAIDAISK